MWYIFLASAVAVLYAKLLFGFCILTIITVILSHCDCYHCDGVKILRNLVDELNCCKIRASAGA